MAINPEIHTFIQKFTIYMFEEVSSINHEWRNSSTSKASKLVTVTGCRESMGKWHHDMPQHSAEPIPHTRPWPPRCQSRCLTNQSSWRTRLSSAPRPRPGNGDRARLASSSRALPFKSWSLKSGEHMTFNSDMWISLIQNLANNAEINSFLQHLHLVQLSLNRDEWWNYRTSKPSKLVTVTGCRGHDIFHQIAAAFTGAGHTPGLGPLGTNFVDSQSDVSDGLVYLQRLGQGLEKETDQGWRLHPGFYCSNHDHWNPENTWHLTLTCESLWYRT